MKPKDGCTKKVIVILYNTFLYIFKHVNIVPFCSYFKIDPAKWKFPSLFVGCTIVLLILSLILIVMSLQGFFHFFSFLQKISFFETYVGLSALALF